MTMISKKQLEILSEDSSITNEIKSIFKIFAKEISDAKSRPSSITQMASRDLIMQFPTLISDDISFHYANVINNAFEKDMAITMMLVVGSQKNIDLDEYKSPTEYLKKFHVNLGFELGDENDLALSKLNAHLLKENVTDIFKDYKPIYETKFLSEADNDDMNDLFDDLRASREYFGLTGKNDPFTMNNSDYGMEIGPTINNANKTSQHHPTPQEHTKTIDDLQNYMDDLFDNHSKYEHNHHNTTQSRIDNINTKMENIEKYLNYAQDHNLKQNELDKSLAKIHNSLKKDNHDVAKEVWNNVRKKLDQHKKDMQKYERSSHRRGQSDRDLLRTGIKPTEVKKANEMAPTVINVSFNFFNDSDHFGYNLDYGVKGVMHVIKSDIFINEIKHALLKGDPIFRFIKWTTGEIKFVKDLLFDIDNIKGDVVQKVSSATSNRILSLVKDRKRIAKFKNIFGKFINPRNNNILPNCSFVITESEAKILKDVCKRDLFDIPTIKGLMKRYFLLQFAIVDEINDLIYVIKDGDHSYQEYSLDSLEEQTKNNTNAIMKSMASMMNKSY